MSSWKRNRPRKPLTLDTLKLRLTAAIQENEKILMTAESEQLKIQASNAIAGLSSRYSKLLEKTDFEERLAALERKNNMRKVS